MIYFIFTFSKSAAKYIKVILLLAPGMSMFLISDYINMGFCSDLELRLPNHWLRAILILLSTF